VSFASVSIAVWMRSVPGDETIHPGRFFLLFFRPCSAATNALFLKEFENERRASIHSKSLGGIAIANGNG
jgi:hypothetical protein